MGIAVSDLNVSAAFYRDVIGMVETLELTLSNMDEIVLDFPNGGPRLVLMQFKDGKERNLSRLPVKLVLSFDDPTDAARRIREAGYTVVREPGPSEELGGAILGFARDPDGYLLELVPAH